MKSVKYIVTGGAGLIGSATVWALNQRGENDILIVDHLGESEKWKNLRALQYTDYVEREDFYKFIEEGGDFDGLEAIIHLGACSATTEKNATYLIHNNFECTKAMALYALEKKSRFLYASSAATYGDGEKGYSDSEKEIEQLRPLNMYGYSKQLFDLWARKQGILSSVAGMKFTNVYGPNELHKGGMRSVVLRAFEQIRDTGKMCLFKSYREEYRNGEQMRDFLYVKDAVDMVLYLLDNKNLNGLYNIGSGKAETWNSLVKAAFNAMGKPLNVEYVEMPESLREKYQYYTCAEMTKLRNAGYTKTPRSLEDAVFDCVANYYAKGKFLGD